MTGPTRDELRADCKAIMQPVISMQRHISSKNIARELLHRLDLEASAPADVKAIREHLSKVLAAKPSNYTAHARLDWADHNAMWLVKSCQALLAHISTMERAPAPIQQHYFVDPRADLTPEQFAVEAAKFDAAAENAVPVDLRELDAKLRAPAPGLTREQIVETLAKNITITDDSEEWEGPCPRLTGINKAADAILALQSPDKVKP